MNFLDNLDFLASLQEFLAEDIGRGDITTNATVPIGVKGTGSFLAKEPLVVCGLKVSELVFQQLDPSSGEIETKFADGDEVESGTIFGKLSGFADTLLTGERLALNLMQRMSGIATLSRAYSRAVEGTNAKVVDTRKTTPGLRMLEKYAVRVGGCKNHRFGLDDGVLIKDNHIELAGGIREAIDNARKEVGHLHKIEVEISNWGQLREAIKHGADIIMLDNQAPEEAEKLVKMARDLNPSVLLEASGGIDISNVKEYAETGVDLISVGKLTHSARALDISFKIKAES